MTTNSSPRYRHPCPCPAGSAIGCRPCRHIRLLSMRIPNRNILALYHHSICPLAVLSFLAGTNTELRHSRSQPNRPLSARGNRSFSELKRPLSARSPLTARKASTAASFSRSPRGTLSSKPKVHLSPFVSHVCRLVARCAARFVSCCCLLWIAL